MNEVNATPHAELIFELMNPNKPKNERENAAVREIERLRETRQAIIAGALFDFMGWLTSRKERIVLSFSDEASPAVNAIRDFAKMRGLSLDDAQVQDWQDNATPPAAQRKPHYDKTEMNCFVQKLYDQKMREGKRGHYETMFHVVHRAIEAAHGIGKKPDAA